MRLIDEAKVINEIERFKGYLDDDMIMRIKIAINKLPTIDADPIKHGKWIRILDTRFGEKLNDIIGCSVCNIYFSSMDMIRRSYCPNCGARMDAE